MESRASGSSSSEYVRVCPFFFFFFFLRVHFREEEGNCQWNDIQFDGSTVKRHVAKKMLNPWEIDPSLHPPRKKTKRFLFA